MLVVSYKDVRDARDLLYLQKQRELLEVATQLDGQLDTSFQQILHDNNAEDLSSDEQTQVLSKVLQPKVMQISSMYPHVGLGFYSKQLNRNVAVGPSFDPSFLREVIDSGTLQIYNTGKFASFKMDQSILWGGKPILAVHYPIYRNGRIIGHTFANTKIEDIESAYKLRLANRVLWLTGIWLFVVGFIAYIFYKLRTGTQKLIENINRAQESSTLSSFPEYIPVLDTVNKLRKRIIEKSNVIKWMVQESKAGIIIIDKNLKTILVNDFAANYIRHQEKTGLDYKAWAEPELLPIKQSLLMRVLAGESFVGEKLIRKDKTIIELNLSPITDPYTKEVVAAACYFWDVTESEKRNKMLLDTTCRLMQLLELCPFPILELDKNGCIVRINKSMLDLYNETLPYKREELIGKSIRELSSELGIAFENSLIAKVMQKQEVKNEHVETLGRHWIVNGLPIYDPETRLFSGVLAIYHDITKYEHFKNEMARLEYLHAVGETASSVAHELRNPATTIRGFVQLLSRKCKNEHSSYYSLILEELDRMNEIIEEFLSLSRNRLIPKMPSDLNEILTSLFPLLMADALKNDVELKYDLCEKIRTVDLNSKEMRQLVLNLARNGMDAMKPKGTLTIATKNMPNGIELTIKDTGSGMSSEMLQRIFEPFYTSKQNGTGLGLSVCRNIVEGHDGRIEVQSKLGCGTTFAIFLPIAKT